MERRAEILGEVRDRFEAVASGDYDAFLAAMVPQLLGLLSGTQPQFADTPTQRVRHVALEIINRLPANQVSLSLSHNLSYAMNEPLVRQ